jgi:hypothetical protein
MNRVADNKNPEMTCLLISRFPLYLWEYSQQLLMVMHVCE